LGVLQVAVALLVTGRALGQPSTVCFHQKHTGTGLNGALAGVAVLMPLAIRIRCHVLNLYQLMQ
jgi:hypothetical protein